MYFLIKGYKTLRELRWNMLGSTFPQYYFSMTWERYSTPKSRNSALWIVITHLLKCLNNYAAVKFATQVREIIKIENEPIEC